MSGSEFPERVGHGRDLGRLADAQGLYEKRGTSNFGALEQKVANLEGWLDDIKHDIKDLNVSIKDLSTSIMSLTQPKWSSWIAGATLFCLVTGAMWQLAIRPVEVQVARLATEVVPRDVLDERRAAEAAHFAEIDAKLERLGARK